MAAMSLRTCSATRPLSTAPGSPTHRPRLRPCLRSRRIRRRRRPRCPRRPRRPRCRRARRALPSRRGWRRCPCRGSPSLASASESPSLSSPLPPCSTWYGRLQRETTPNTTRPPTYLPRSYLAASCPCGHAPLPRAEGAPLPRAEGAPLAQGDHPMRDRWGMMGDRWGIHGRQMGDRWERSAAEEGLRRRRRLLTVADAAAAPGNRSRWRVTMHLASLTLTFPPCSWRFACESRSPTTSACARRAGRWRGWRGRQPLGGACCSAGARGSLGGEWPAWRRVKQIRR